MQPRECASGLNAEGGRMEYFLQQLINGITLGSIYGLIAIGYTMVYGIIGMINFAHGDVFMVGRLHCPHRPSFALGLIGISGLRCRCSLSLIWCWSIAMMLAGVYNWTVERVAYRPLRGSFRLAPLISAIGMSIVLQEYVRIAQGGRPKPMQPIISGGHDACAQRRLRRAALQHADHHHRVDPRPDGDLHLSSSPAPRSAAPSAPASRT